MTHPSSEPDANPPTDRLGTNPDDGAGAAGEQRRAAAAAVLDRPLDDKNLQDRVRRPGMARSTRLLLLAVVVVVAFGVGALVGRATAPRTGPGSVPAVVGVVESVTASQITVRTPDGGVSVLAATAGTRVAVDRPGGLVGLRAGQPVTVVAERDPGGAVRATHIDLPR